MGGTLNLSAFWWQSEWGDLLSQPMFEHVAKPKVISNTLCERQEEK